ncbi:hypothetical protein JXA88_03895 [Candidatus Fermentibacteria bacterium]|nr:hypothetical protein [Candidatus Fermentibacteria bacterium]
MPAGETNSLYVPMIETNPGNTIYMAGEIRDITGSTLVFRSFNGWTGELIDLPGEVTLFSGDPVFRQGYENYQFLYRDGRLITSRHRGTLPQEIHRLRWDCSGTPSGVFICLVNVGNEAASTGVIVVH